MTSWSGGRGSLREPSKGTEREERQGRTWMVGQLDLQTLRGGRQR